MLQIIKQHLDPYRSLFNPVFGFACKALTLFFNQLKWKKELCGSCRRVWTHDFFFMWGHNDPQLKMTYIFRNPMPLRYYENKVYNKISVNLDCIMINMAIF